MAQIQYASIKPYLKFLTPTSEIIAKKVLFMGKTWSRVDQLSVLWQRIKYFLNSGKLLNNAISIRLIDRNIKVIVGSIKHSIAKKRYSLNDLRLNHRCLIEMKRACEIIKASSIKTNELTSIITLEKSIEKLTGALLQGEKLMKKKPEINEQLVRLLKNSQKAITEHRQREEHNIDVYVTVEEGMFTLAGLTKKHPQLMLSYTFSEGQGPREGMEDAHFFKKIPQGYLTGVFDGHGGKDVAEFANAEFQKRFSRNLKELQEDVRSAFEETINQIHDEVALRPEWDDMGSTALICFIDQKSNLIYTATLGDTEANIYRKIGSQIKSIPLSVVRDWSSPKDAARAAAAWGLVVSEVWPPQLTPKERRYPHNGLNVSRAIGDTGSNIHDLPAIIHKPKITVNQLLNEDKIILACDGLKDFVPEFEIAKIVNESNNIAEELVSKALKKWRSQDNVTVIAIKVENQSKPSKNLPSETVIHKTFRSLGG